MAKPLSASSDCDNASLFSKYFFVFTQSPLEILPIDDLKAPESSTLSEISFSELDVYIDIHGLKIS